VRKRRAEPKEIESEEDVENFGGDTQGTEARSPTPHHHHQKKVDVNKRSLIVKVFPSVHALDTGFVRVFLIALIRRFGSCSGLAVCAGPDVRV